MAQDRCRCYQLPVINARLKKEKPEDKPARPAPKNKGAKSNTRKIHTEGEARKTNKAQHTLQN